MDQKRVFFIVFAVVATAVKATGPYDECKSFSPVTVAVSNYRNESGHWVSEVVVEGRRDEGHGLQASHESGCCHVDVQHRPYTCKNGETRADILLTFSVQPSKGGNTWRFETTTTAPPSPLPPTPSTPPVGYVTLQGAGHYKFHAKALSWSAARHACRAEGGDLAHIDTLQKLNFIKVMGSGWTWIDLHERGTNGVYYTASDEEWVQPDALKWYPGQPNYPGGADCVLLLMADGRIGDNPCEAYSRYFVCEIPWSV